MTATLNLHNNELSSIYNTEQGDPQLHMKVPLKSIKTVVAKPWNSGNVGNIDVNIKTPTMDSLTIARKWATMKVQFSITGCTTSPGLSPSTDANVAQYGTSPFLFNTSQSFLDPLCINKSIKMLQDTIGGAVLTDNFREPSVYDILAMAEFDPKLCKEKYGLDFTCDAGLAELSYKYGDQLFRPKDLTTMNSGYNLAGVQVKQSVASVSAFPETQCISEYLLSGAPRKQLDKYYKIVSCKFTTNQLDGGGNPIVLSALKSDTIAGMTYGGNYYPVQGANALSGDPWYPTPPNTITQTVTLEIGEWIIAPWLHTEYRRNGLKRSIPTNGCSIETQIMFNDNYIQNYMLKNCMTLYNYAGSQTDMTYSNIQILDFTLEYQMYEPLVNVVQKPIKYLTNRYEDASSNKLVQVVEQTLTNGVVDVSKMAKPLEPLVSYTESGLTQLPAMLLIYAEMMNDQTIASIQTMASVTNTNAPKGTKNKISNKMYCDFKKNDDGSCPIDFRINNGPNILESWSYEDLVESTMRSLNENEHLRNLILGHLDEYHQESWYGNGSTPNNADFNGRRSIPFKVSLPFLLINLSELNLGLISDTLPLLPLTQYASKPSMQYTIKYQLQLPQEKSKPITDMLNKNFNVYATAHCYRVSFLSTMLDTTVTGTVPTKPISFVFDQNLLEQVLQEAHSSSPNSYDADDLQGGSLIGGSFFSNIMSSIRRYAPQVLKAIRSGESYLSTIPEYRDSGAKQIFNFADNILKSHGYGKKRSKTPKRRN